MRYGLIISIFAHVAILLAAIIALPEPDQFKVDQQEAIPVEIVSVEDMPKRMATAKKPKKDLPKTEKPKPVKVEKKIEEIKDAPKPAKEIKQAAKQPAPAPEPKPEPEPVPKPKTAEPEPAPKDLLKDLIKELDQKKPEPEPKPEPEKKQANTQPVPKPRVKPKPPRKVVRKEKDKELIDDISALLNKIPDERQAPPKPQDETGTPRQAERTTSGNDDAIAATMLDWFRQRVGQCWSIPAGVREGERLVVKVQIELDRNGYVIGQPAIVNRSNHPAFGAASRSAVAAVLGCQPYDKLPPEKHDQWKVIRMNFDPSVMLAIN